MDLADDDLEPVADDLPAPLLPALAARVEAVEELVRSVVASLEEIRTLVEAIVDTMPASAEGSAET